MNVRSLLPVRLLPVRYPKSVLAIYALVAAVSVVGVTRLRQEEDMLAFLPATDPDIRLFQDVSRRFGSLRVALIGVEAPDGQDVFRADTLARIDATSRAIRDVQGVDRVLSLTTVTDVVASPAGAEVTALIGAIPQTATEERALRAKVISRDAVVGNVVSEDGRAALLLVYLADGAGDREVVQALRATARSTLGPLRVHFGGAPFAGQAIYEEAQADVWRLSPIALLLLALVVVLAFRDPVGVALTVLSVGFSILVVTGAMGFVGARFTIATSTLPVILFASGSSYAVHVLGRYYLARAHRSPHDAIVETLDLAYAPLTVAAFTTAVGFFSFLATDVKPMRSFGLACGVGVLLCWIASITLVPAVVTLWPRRAASSASLRLVGVALVAVWSWARRHRRAVAGAVVVTGAACLVPATHVEVRMDPRAFFRPGSDPWRADRFLDERFGGSTFIQVAVEGDLTDPPTLREVARLEDFARALPGVTQVSSVLEPLRLVSEAMGGGRRLPGTRAQAGNLYFFLEGQPGLRSLVDENKQAALVHVRLRGDARPALDALEAFAHQELGRSASPAARSAERIAWAAASTLTQASDVRDRVAAILSSVKLPEPEDGEWRERRRVRVAELLAGDEALPLPAVARDAIAARLVDGDYAQAAEALRAAAPSPEEGEFAYAGITARLADEQRALALARALPRVVAAAGVDPDSRKRVNRLRNALDDLFAPQPEATPARALVAQVAGQPILDRGFARSVDANQTRSLSVALIAVAALLYALFRSRLALVALVPSLLTLLVLFALLGVTHTPIDLGTSLVAGLATGAGSDFTLYYIWYLRRSSADEVSRSIGPSMVVSILLVSLGFAVLALGRSPVMHLFGLLAAGAMSLSALLTCVVVPAWLGEPAGNDNRT